MKISDRDLSQNLDTFLQGPYATKGRKEILMRYLTFSTQHQEPVLIPPENDILIKLDLIDHIRNEYLESPDAKNFEFTSWHFAFLLHMPLEALRAVRDDRGTIAAVCDDAEVFCRLFSRGLQSAECAMQRQSDERKIAIHAKRIQQGTSSQQTGPDDQGKQVVTSSVEVSVSGDANFQRKDGTVQEVMQRKRRREIASNSFSVLDRDNRRCVISQRTLAIEACHITPFATSKSERATQIQSKYWYIASLLLERTTFEQLESLLSEAESPDISWNAITLSKDVHFQLDRGLLALKPMACKFDEGRLEVSFQVYWLPENGGRDPKGPVKPDMEAVRRIPKPLSEPEALEQVIESSRYNHQPIVTGDVIYIRMLSRKDAMNMVLALELRWAVSMVMFMAGAAGRSDDELDTYETKDEDEYDG